MNRYPSGENDQAMAVMAVPGDFRHLAPDHLAPLQASPPEPSKPQGRALHRRAAARVVLGIALHIREIDDIVRREIRMQDDVAHPALAARGHVRRVADGAELAAIGADQPQPAALLADQSPPIGQETSSPRGCRKLSNGVTTICVPRTARYREGFALRHCRAGTRGQRQQGGQGRGL